MYAIFSHISHSLTNLEGAREAVHFYALHSGVGHQVSVYVSMHISLSRINKVRYQLRVFGMRSVMVIDTLQQCYQLPVVITKEAI